MTIAPAVPAATPVPKPPLFTGLHPLMTVDQFLVFPETASLSAVDKKFIELFKAGKGKNKNDFLIVLNEIELLDQISPDDGSVEIVDEPTGICVISGKKRLSQAQQAAKETFGAFLENAHTLTDQQVATVYELRVVQRRTLRYVAEGLVESGIDWIEPASSQLAGHAICEVAAQKLGFFFKTNKDWNGVKAPSVSVPAPVPAAVAP